MAQLDSFGQKLLQDYTSTQGKTPSAPPQLDDFAQKLLDEHLGYGPTLDATKSKKASAHDPAADRWGFLRHAIDAAAYGNGTDASQREARDAWEKEKSQEARLAWSIGRSAPAVLASTILGRTILAGAEALGATSAGEFLTGMGGSNVLSRGASLATAGAGQGAVSAGYSNAMGQPDSILGGAAAGAIAGPVLGALGSPLTSSIGPTLARTARNYMDATGVPLRLGQMGSAAPPVVRAMSKLLGMGKNDIPVLTKSLMAKTGSSSPVATRAALADARGDIRTSVDAAVPSANVSAKNAHGAYTLSDDDVSKLFQQLAPAMGKSPATSAIHAAQEQWTTVGKIERMLNNSSPEAQANGLIEPKAVLGEINNVRGPQYPNGTPPDIQAMGEGANIFARPASVGPTLAHASALGTVGAATTGLLAEHAIPMLEQSLGIPGSAAAATALGTAGYGAVGALMNSPTYLNLLLNKGYSANPLIPLVQQAAGNALGANMGVTAAHASEANKVAENDTTPPSELQPVITAAGTKYGVDPDLLARQLYQESGFKNLPPNRAGAAGVAQFIPETARTYGVDVTDPTSSINGQAHMMSDLHQRFNGNTGLALAGYNWGPANVQRWLANGADPKKLPDETRNYVQNITGKPIESWLSSTPDTSTHITVPLDPKNITPSANALASSFGPQAGSDAAINTLTGSP